MWNTSVKHPKGSINNSCEFKSKPTANPAKILVNKLTNLNWEALHFDVNKQASKLAKFRTLMLKQYILHGRLAQLIVLC